MGLSPHGGIRSPRIRDQETPRKEPQGSAGRAPSCPPLLRRPRTWGTELKALSCLKDEDDLTRPPAAQAPEAFLGPGFRVLGFWSLRVQELGSEVLGSSAWGPQPL